MKKIIYLTLFNLLLTQSCITNTEQVNDSSQALSSHTMEMTITSNKENSNVLEGEILFKKILRIKSENDIDSEIFEPCLVGVTLKFPQAVKLMNLENPLGIKSRNIRLTYDFMEESERIILKDLQGRFTHFNEKEDGYPVFSSKQGKRLFLPLNLEGVENLFFDIYTFTLKTPQSNTDYCKELMK